jgi:hypothetical protein
MSRGLRPLPSSLRSIKLLKNNLFCKNTPKTNKNERKIVLLFRHGPTQTNFNKLVTLCTCSERLFHGLQIYMRLKFLGSLDNKIQLIFVIDTNGNSLVIDPDNLTFFLKVREHNSSLFL